MVSLLFAFHGVCMSTSMLLQLKYYSNTMTLRMRIRTHNSTLVYIQLCLRPSSTQKKNLSDIHKHRHLEQTQFLLYNTHTHTHSQHFSPPGYKLFGSKWGHLGWIIDLLVCVSWADLGSVPMLVLSLPAPCCSGPSLISLEWQWAQLFLSFNMHLQADL